MASWNSFPLEITYETFGWLAFFSWSISFYPQVFLNFRRKSVVGLNFDFVLLNLTKHSSYMIYNVCLYFSPVIQQQYLDKYGSGQMIPVAANDVAFSIHAVLLTATLLSQIVIYERGTQKVSKISIGIVCVVWFFAAICFFVALPSHSWLWLISIFNSIQVFMTMIKYIPQAFMNFARKSTDGFSIGNIMLDFTGGLANYAQMTVQSIDQNSWVNFYGNIGKISISLVSIFFDIIFMCQHFVLYRGKKATVLSELEQESREPLVKSIDESAIENVPDMKREARQHGTFRTYPVQPSRRYPRPETHVQRLNSVPVVAGSFSDVRSKASSHSDFTGKCGKSQWVQCHLNPVSKPNDKTKGTQKFRTSNMAGFKISGHSATGILDYLDSFNEEDEIYDHHASDPEDDYENGGTHVRVDDDNDFMAKFWSLHDKQNDSDNNNDEDDHTSFCDVGFMQDIEEDEGWCLVREM
ncbi:hypothetical protein V6N13_086731 [Hibiscus sabdariffa]|uniref:Cystinosin homolog n=1 Tax=Hibiscus sabdariffa TaxID=183260 RepID=A0ABR2FUV8_9ROSI